jgi:radical SAM superfamily enzyme YgiQ (UPF0313 family)
MMSRDASSTSALAGSLRAPGAVLLVSCYELGHQPLGIASPAAFLRHAGFSPAALDLSVEQVDPGRVAAARLIAVSVPMHTALRLGVRAADQLSAMNPGAHVCFFGLYAGLNAAWLLGHGGDSAIGGEFEAPLVALAEALDAGRPAPAGIGTPGRITGAHLERLDFPVPSRELLPPLAKYARLDHRGTFAEVGYVEASRGCRHHCLHCPIPPAYDGRFFVVPPEVVLADTSRLVALGARHITFGDPDFLNAPTHSMRIVRAIHAEFPALTFDFTAKVEHVLEHRALFPELTALGGLFMVSAVESLSDVVLGHLEKGHTRADVFAALEIVRSAGIAMRPSLVAFTPWTTLDDYLDVLDWIGREDLADHVDPVQFSIRLLLPPGSLLLARDAIRPYLGEFDAASFQHRWAHPDPRMDRLHADVSALVAGATRAAEDPRVTIRRVRERALALSGRVHERGDAERGRMGSAGALDAAAISNGSAAPARRHRAPRLTEPWFC